MVNAYSKCSLAYNRVMWADLVTIRDSFGVVVWCVSSDFNFTYFYDDRVIDWKSLLVLLGG